MYSENRDGGCGSGGRWLASSGVLIRDEVSQARANAISDAIKTMNRSRAFGLCFWLKRGMVAMQPLTELFGDELRSYLHKLVYLRACRSSPAVALSLEGD